MKPAVRAYSAAGSYGLGWSLLALAGAVAGSQKRGLWLKAAAIPPAMLLINTAVKLVVRRRRPELDDLPPLGRVPTTLSFPSAHASISFASAVVLSEAMPEARGLIWAAAVAMAATRPALGLHYPTDAVAGALLGACVGRLARTTV